MLLMMAFGTIKIWRDNLTVLRSLKAVNYDYLDGQDTEERGVSIYLPGNQVDQEMKRKTEIFETV